MRSLRLTIVSWFLIACSGLAGWLFLNHVMANSENMAFSTTVAFYIIIGELAVGIFLLFNIFQLKKWARNIYVVVRIGTSVATMFLVAEGIINVFAAMLVLSLLFGNDWDHFR
jgi:hypothetical protein